MKIFIPGIFLSTVMAIRDIKTIDSSIPASSDVQYNCVFENQWTRERHPRNYPSDYNHWSRQVLASHGSDYNMWKEGSLASDAVKTMAEAGGTANMVRELEDSESSFEIGYDKYLSLADQSMKFHDPIPMTSENHYISVIAKIVPSPDWFSGFHDFNAINEEKQTWYKEFTIETYPYDAGTEDGNTYEIFNEQTNPRQPITRFDKTNIQNGIFMNPEGNDILSVASYTCTLNTYSSSNTDIKKISSFVPSSKSVEYNCAFENQWNEERHPWEFPSDSWSVNWSRQILASHDSDYNMWKEGVKASKAVQKLAESGGIGDIIQELQDRGDSYDIGYDKYLYSQDPKVIFEPLRMSSSRHYISAISKLVPSPDWFSGFHDFNAIDEDSNTWYQEFTLPLYPFDAGTKNGETYTTDRANYNADKARTIPPAPITEFTLDNLPNNQIFLNKDRDRILPVATFTCTLSSLNNMEPTISPIFQPLTPSPAGQVPLAQSTNAAFTSGLIVGAIASMFIVGTFMYTNSGCFRDFLKVKSSKSMSGDISTSSSECEEGGMNIEHCEFA